MIAKSPPTNQLAARGRLQPGPSEAPTITTIISERINAGGGAPTSIQ